MENLNLNYNETEESRELTLYIENDGSLYRSTIKPTILNLAKKYAKGDFNVDLAIKAFYNISITGAKKYAQEFAIAKDWNNIFSVEDRKSTAMALLEGYFENINGENPLN